MNSLPKCRLLSSFSFLFALAIAFSLSVAAAQEEHVPPSTSQDEIEKYEEIQQLAKEQRIDAAVQQNKTGTDPRDFSLKWMPFYRYTKLENGLTQQDLTAFGTVPFTPRLGLFFEVPLAQYRDFSELNGIYHQNCLTPRSHSPHLRTLRAFNSLSTCRERNRNKHTVTAEFLRD